MARMSPRLMPAAPPGWPGDSKLLVAWFCTGSAPCTTRLEALVVYLNVCYIDAVRHKRDQCLKKNQGHEGLGKPSTAARA